MVIPDGTKSTISFKIPKLLWNSAIIAIAFITLLASVLTYDYFQILKQVYRNKYLSTENSQLKEQIQILQLKMNSVLTDVERIQEFEKKLRVMSGAQERQRKKVKTQKMKAILKILLEDKKHKNVSRLYATQPTLFSKVVTSKNR